MVAREMRVRFVIGITIVASLLVFASVHTAMAQWAAMSSGYAVTTDNHGEDVIIGNPVTGWAGTWDEAVTSVHIIWIRPDGTEFPSPSGGWFYSLDGPYLTPDYPDGVPEEISNWAIDNPGYNIRYVHETIIPDQLSSITDPPTHWTFKAIFWDTSIHGEDHTDFMVRATSFNVVPEVPFGTIAILLSWCGILSVFALRRKRLAN